MNRIFDNISENLKTLFSEAEKDIFIFSPWIKKDALMDLTSSSNWKDLNIRVLTRSKEINFLDSSSDIEAYEELLDLGAEIRTLENLHAKIFVADNNKAILTSANFTNAGLGISRSGGNFEIGIYIDEDEQVSNLLDVMNDCYNNKSEGIIDEEWLKSAKEDISKRQSDYVEWQAKKPRIADFPKPKQIPADTSQFISNRDLISSISIDNNYVMAKSIEDKSTKIQAPQEFKDSKDILPQLKIIKITPTILGANITSELAGLSGFVPDLTYLKLPFWGAQNKYNRVKEEIFDRLSDRFSNSIVKNDNTGGIIVIGFIDDKPYEVRLPGPLCREIIKYKKKAETDKDVLLKAVTTIIIRMAANGGFHRDAKTINNAIEKYFLRGAKRLI